MSAGESAKIPEEGTLVCTVLFCEKSTAEFFYKSKADLAACLALAFPEQLVAVSPTEFKLRDKFDCKFWFQENIKPKYRDDFKSWLQKVEKGVHQLPRKGDFFSDDPLSKDLESRHGLWPFILLTWLEDVNTAFANSESFIRKWSVIDGPEVKEGVFGKPKRSKILAIGVYSR